MSTGTSELNTTHRINVRQRGGPEVLRLEAFDLPEPRADEACVRIEAAGVSAYDVMLRGHRFPGFPPVPYTPGEDFVGIVEAVGQNVTGLEPGQRVGAWTFGDAGAYAEHIIRPAAQLVPVPDGLDPPLAAGVIVNGLTAHIALRLTIAVKAGERLLVQGAGGGLGSALLQLARHAGLETFGCDGEPKHPQIEADGAVPIDYRDRNAIRTIRELTDGGADAVVDVVGGPGQLIRSYRMLRRGGRLLMLGMAGTKRYGTRIILPSLLTTAILAIWPDGRRIASGPGMETYPKAHPDWYRETLAGLFDATANGVFDPHVAALVPLREASRAHRMLEQGQVSGKLVLVATVE